MPIHGINLNFIGDDASSPGYVFETYSDAVPVSTSGADTFDGMLTFLETFRSKWQSKIDASESLPTQMKLSKIYDGVTPAHFNVATDSVFHMAKTKLSPSCQFSVGTPLLEWITNHRDLQTCLQGVDLTDFDPEPEEDEYNLRIDYTNAEVRDIHKGLWCLQMKMQNLLGYKKKNDIGHHPRFSPLMLMTTLFPGKTYLYQDKCDVLQKGRGCLTGNEPVCKAVVDEVVAAVRSAGFNFDSNKKAQLAWKLFDCQTPTRTQATQVPPFRIGGEAYVVVEVRSMDYLTFKNAMKDSKAALRAKHCGGECAIWAGAQLDPRQYALPHGVTQTQLDDANTILGRRSRSIASIQQHLAESKSGRAHLAGILGGVKLRKVE